MKPIRAVVFDLDGTLLNTLVDLASSVNYALTAGGYPIRTLDEVRSFVGNGVTKLIARSLPASATQAEVAQTLAVFKEHYAVHQMDVTAPYEGIPSLLATLHQAGVRMAVVSNKLQSAVEELRQHFFAEHITVAVGDEPPRPVKPAPDGTLAALERLGVPPEEALFVGDSDVDVCTAHNVGMRCLAVSWGFRDAASLRAAGPDHVAASPAEACQWMMERV
ncbi:MAG: HAD family hydrolase [Ruminococcaceae bacterium]|nr:HAD family hydrolase [Oscillospiraceae bacterium]